ncbi:MAG: hypothetical protein NT099_05635, partial [Candidatus Saganbacteria bacterium]|nr:hypothetical protein [Candidatus Saganbacteria bacterium]
AVQKGKVTDLAKQKSSLRVQTSVEAGGDLDRSKVLNGWHCSDGQVAAIREVAWIYGRRGLGGAFSEDAIDYIMRGEVPASLVARATRWFTRKTSDVILPTADILRFPIYDLLVDVANGGRRSGATSICHAANIIASFYDIDGYSPRDMQAPDIALMLKEAALFAARQKILTPEELSALEIQPRRTNLTILVGASGIGKTTILERLEKDKSATILKVKTTRETAGDVGSERESPDVFWGRALQGRYVAAESSYGVDYAILDRDIKEALLKGGPVVVSCGPEMAKVLSERVAQVARGLGLQGAAMVPTVKVVYLQEENDKVLEGHLKTREQHTGRPAADRIKDAKQVAKHLRDKLEPKDPRTLTPTLLPGVQKIMVTATQTEDQTVALVTALLGEATEAPNLKTVKANSPRVELVARKYLRDLIPALQSATLDPTSADTREAGLGTAMRDNYNRFLREVYRAEHGRNPILPHEDVRPDEKGKEDQIQEYRQLKWIV